MRMRRCWDIYQPSLRAQDMTDELQEETEEEEEGEATDDGVDEDDGLN